MVVILFFKNIQKENAKRHCSGDASTVSSAAVGRQEGRAPALLRGKGGGGGGEAGSGAWVSGPEPRKERWSIGKLFRRRKKNSDSDVSVSSDEGAGPGKHKKKTKKQRLVRNTDPDKTRDDPERSRSATKIIRKEYTDDGVLSDPSAGFASYAGQGFAPRGTGKESQDRRGPGSSGGIQDGSLRKGRKGRIKARVEAMRNAKNESSSDDESQRSTSSSMLRFRSDDSLANHSKDGSIRRTRGARTDRYHRRLSRDDETQLDREAELIQRSFSRSEAELLALKRRVLSTPQAGGSAPDPDYSEPLRVPDAKLSQNGIRVLGYTNANGFKIADRLNQRHLGLSASNSSVYSYPAGGIRFNARVNDENVDYSVPYGDASGQHPRERIGDKTAFRRSASLENGSGICSPANHENENVMVVKFPLGSAAPPRKEAGAPPAPPPRDPQRRVTTPMSCVYENARPMSRAPESGATRILQYRSSEGRSVPVPQTRFFSQNTYENSDPIVNNSALNWAKRPMSTSEDHIAVQGKYTNDPFSNMYQNEQPKRPSSVTTEVLKPSVYNRYLARPQLTNGNIINKDPRRRYTQENTNNNSEFLYFADKTPRSRKPIHIEKISGNSETPVTEPQPAAQPAAAIDHCSVAQRPRNASEFWHKMDSQETRRRQFGHNRTLSDQSVNIGYRSQHSLPKTQPILLVNYLAANGNSSNSRLSENNYKNHSIHAHKREEPIRAPRITNKENEPICYSNIDIIPMDDVRKVSYNNSVRDSDDEFSKGRRKSTNLEDALSELEAIYNSLGLGDEDLLDRAEHQEMMAAPKTTEAFPYSGSCNDNYFRFPSYSDSSDAPIMMRRNSVSRKSAVPDKKHDDMAYRRLNPHERPASRDANTLVSQVSYMLASPVPGETVVDTGDVDGSEPNVILDDVVFRNIKQANNYLKIEDPQLPFGIPIGPISPAPNSDYLHATPEIKSRNRFIPQRSPDIVTDDLAFRTLRKDSRNPSGMSKEDYESIINNNSDNKSLSQTSKVFDNHVIKKKRAVRSLSANIFTLIQREIDDALGLCNDRALDKAQSIPDLPDAVVEFGKSGKLPPNFKTSQQLLLDHPSNLTLDETRPIFKYDISVENKESEYSYKSNDDRGIVHLEPERASKEEINCNQVHLPIRPTKEDFNITLDIMAQEAHETSARLGIALKELQRENPTSSQAKEIKYKSEDSLKDIGNNIKSMNDLQSLSYQPNMNMLQVKDTKQEDFFSRKPFININYQTGDLEGRIFDSSRYAKNNSEKDFLNKITSETNGSVEDSLMKISNQLNIVGHQLKSTSEQKEIFNKEGFKLKALANQCDININRSLDISTETKSAQTETKINPVTKYEIPLFNPKLGVSVGNVKLNSESTNVLLTNSNLKKFDEMNSFDDLRKGISELLDGFSNINEDKPKIGKKIELFVLKDSNKTIEVPSSLPDRLLFPKNESLNQNKIAKSIKTGKESPIDSSSHDDINVKPKDNRASPEYNSSEELAMIFNLNREDSVKTNRVNQAEINKIEPKDDSHLDLNSPRLVKTVNQTIRKHSLEESREPCIKKTEDLPETVARKPASDEAPWRVNRRKYSTDDGNKGTCGALTPAKRRSWYHDPNTLLLACSYTLICTQQLAGLDFLTVLGILLAMISIIAMLII